MELTSPTAVTRTVNVALPTAGSIVSAWSSAMSAAQPGDRLLIPGGTYSADGNLDVSGKTGVTIEFAGDTTIGFTSTTSHSLRVMGCTNVFIKGRPAANSFTEPKVVLQTAGVSGRGDQDLSGHSTLLVQGSTGVRIQDVLASGAKAAGVFCYQSSDVKYNRVWSRNSLADAYHIVDTCSYIELTDCTSQNSGDDGVGIVHYSPRSAPSQTTHHVTVNRHRVLGGNARGVAAINCHDVTISQLFVRESRAAGYLVANELYTYPGMTVSQGAYTVSAEDVYLYRCNTDAGIDHGSFAVINSDPAVDLNQGLSIGNLVTEDPPTGAWNQVKGTGDRTTVLTLTGWKHYGSGATNINAPQGVVNGTQSPQILAAPSPTAGGAQWAATVPTGTATSPASTVDPTNLWKAPQQVDAQLAAHPELAPIANQPQALWITPEVDQARVRGWMAAAAGKTALLTVYAVPGRDNGLYSAGGFPDRAAYLNFLTNVVKDGIGTAPAILVFEPDALGLSRNLDATRKAERIETLRQAVSILSTIPNTETYIDASAWVPAGEQADLLRSVGIGNVAGFSTNVSGYRTAAQSTDYGNSVITELANRGTSGKKFVVDTSRSGAGELPAAFPGSEPWFAANQTWCNPPGRRIGPHPSVPAGQPNVRAYLWVKNPGESDGSSPQMASGVPNTFVSTYYGESAPIAGRFWLPLARDLLGLSPQPGNGTTAPPAFGPAVSTGYASDTRIVGLTPGRPYYVQVRSVTTEGRAGPWSTVQGPVTPQ